MYKLYKQDAGRLRYHEAWDEDDCVFEHFGVVGLPGETRQHPLTAGTDPDVLLESLLRPSAESGYEEIDDETLTRLEVVVGGGDQASLANRHALEDQLDDLLAETGLGHCDGGRHDHKEMAAFCFVVDADIARDVIAEDLADSPFAAVGFR